MNFLFPSSSASSFFQLPCLCKMKSKTLYQHLQILFSILPWKRRKKTEFQLFFWFYCWYRIKDERKCIKRKLVQDEDETLFFPHLMLSNEIYLHSWLYKGWRWSSEQQRKAKKDENDEREKKHFLLYQKLPRMLDTQRFTIIKILEIGKISFLSNFHFFSSSLASHAQLEEMKMAEWWCKRNWYVYLYILYENVKRHKNL